MAKFYGTIGFGITTEDEHSVWTEKIIERKYAGDIIRNVRRYESPNETLNDDLNVSNEISIVADPYARDHFHAMRYIVWAGAKWKIRSVTAQFPRLILSIGGVYNGPENNP